MKILIDLTSLADNFSGIERYAACLALEMLKDKNHNYILIFKNEIHPLFITYKSNTGVEMIVISGSGKLFFNQIKLPLEIYRHKADWYLFMAFPVPLLLFKRNMVSTIHDICCWDCPETMNRSSKWYFRISHLVAIRKCKRILTISGFSQNRIMDKLKYPKEQIWLIYCGVDYKFLNYIQDEKTDLEIRAKYNLPDKYLLSLSTLEPRKNLRLLVEAYGELAAEGKIAIPLVLAGRKGWKMDELLKNIDEAVLKNIIFTGFIADEDLPALYGNASLFVFPSKYEGFGMPPLEALACGTRVLSSDAASLSEVLGNKAAYFKNDDLASLKAGLLLSLNPENRSPETGKEIKFLWHAEAERLLGLMGAE